MQQHIVLAVDGSRASRKAARWAVEHARATGADLEAVHAWSAPDMGTDRVDVALAEPADLDREARRELREVLVGLDERGLVAPIAARVVESETVEALLDACRTADLVVVGRHGLSGRLDYDPAAVSHRLIQEACCPVVVVPG